MGARQSGPITAYPVPVGEVLLLTHRKQGLVEKNKLTFGFLSALT